MANGNSAPGADRQIVAFTFTLHGGGRDFILSGSRAQRRIANGRSTNLPSRGKISLEQHWRHSKYIANVVEAVSGIVCWEKGSGVDVEGDQVADSVGILETIEAIHGRSARIGPSFRSFIERSFKVVCQRIISDVVGMRNAWRWHFARSKLMQHLFPNRRITSGMIHVGRIQLEPCGMKPCVVAGHAKLIEDRPLGGCRRRRRLQSSGLYGRTPGRQN